MSAFTTVRAHRAGLWLAAAPLQKAAAAAADCCPEALVWVDRQHWLPARREMFLAGRALAAAALEAAGLRPHRAVVDREPHGAPRWPVGSVGSIAHDAARAIAVVGDAARWAALGVDVEPDLPLPPDAASLVLLPPDEAALIHQFGAAAGQHGRLVFGAKECVHKALHPWRGAWLEFEEVRIDWQGSSADAGRWQAHPLSAAAMRAFAGEALHGEWWRTEGGLWTLLAIPARS